MGITVGIIGCGNISKFHFAGLKKYGAKIKWACDLNSEAASRMALKYGASCTENYMDVVNDAGVDLIDITTTAPSHKEICFSAINAGKAVVCEKTLADNAKDSFEIVRRASEKGTIFYTSYMKRFLPAVRKAKELLPSLGNIISTNVRTYQPWGNVWNGNPSEGEGHTPAGGASAIRRKYGGGILFCGGSHMIDLLCFLLGRPESVYADIHIPEDRDYDLRASAMMKTKGGIVHFEALCHLFSRIGYLYDGWDERVEITGTKGRLEILSPLWEQTDIKSSVLKHYDGESGNLLERRFAPESAFDGAMDFFCRNIEAETQGEQSVFSGYFVDEIISHFSKSSQTGQAVDIAWKI